MTIQQHASFDSSAAELNATSKLVKAWESKNARNAAKAGGISLMALSLAACGGSSTTTTTAVTQADLDAQIAAAAAAAEAQAAAEAAQAVAEAAQAAAEADLAAALNPAGLSLALTTSTDVTTAGSGDDTITGTSSTYAATDIITDTGGADTLNLSLTGNAAAATVVGIETINMSFKTFAEPTADVTNIKNGSVTVSQTQVGGSTAATVSGAGNLTVTAATGISGTLTVTQADGSSLTIDAGTAATVTHSEVADTLASTVTVNGSDASTSITVDGGDQGTVVVNGTTTDRQITTTGKDITINSAYVGTSTSVTTDSEIAYTGENNTDDVASVTMAGVVSLAASALTETATFTGSAAVTATVTGGLGTTTDLAGTNDIALVGTKAVLNAEKITSSGTGTYSVRVTDDIAGAYDASKYDNDIAVRLDVIGTGDTITIDSGATVDYRDATGTDVLELVSSATSVTLGETLNVVANAAATLITNGTAGDGTGTDRFETVNVTSSTVATTVTAIMGDAALTLGGAKAITLAGTSTASSVTNNGVTATYTIDGTNDVTMVGSATARDTITVTSAGEDLSNNTFSNVDIILAQEDAAGDNATDDQTVTVLSSQVTGKSISIIGDLEDTAGGATAADDLVVTADGITIDLSGLTIDSATFSDTTINLNGVNTLAVNITGSNIADNLSNTGSGNITIDGAGGVDTITTGSGDDTITGGGGADIITPGLGTDTVILTEASAASDTVIMTTGGAVKLTTITGFNAGATNGDNLDIDLSDLNALVTDLTTGQGGNVAAGDAVVMTTLDGDGIYSMGTAVTEVFVVDGTIASSSALETALEAGGSHSLKAHTTGFDAGDAMLVLYDDGSSTKLAYVTTTAGIAASATITVNDLVATDIVHFTDIADATSLVDANLDIIA